MLKGGPEKSGPPFFEGRMDLYFVNSGPSDVFLSNGLYRNNGDGTFTDVTKAARGG